MGLQINAEIETNAGPTKDLYIRIENWKINKSVGLITFTTTSWLSKKYADKFLRTYYDEDLKNSIGIVSSKIITYSDDERDGKEVELNNLFNLPMYEEREVETPIFEEREITKELPYISFDEDGEELTLYRSVKAKEEVKVGSKKELKKVMDYSMGDRLTEVSYEYLKQSLKVHFPEEQIQKV